MKHFKGTLVKAKSAFIQNKKVIFIDNHPYIMEAEEIDELSLSYKDFDGRIHFEVKFDDDSDLKSAIMDALNNKDRAYIKK